MTIESAKDYMFGHGLTYRWLAGELGVSRNTVKYWSSTGRIPAHRLRDIRDIIDADAKRKAGIETVDPELELRLVFTMDEIKQ